MTGRPRAYYRKLKLSRIALRELGSQGPDPGPGQVELVRRIGTMSMNDPLGDLLTRIRNAQMRNKTKVSTPGLEAARARARRAQERRLYPRLCGDRAQERPLRVRDRAEVFRRRAGDPRDRARVQARAAASIPRCRTCRASRTVSAVAILSTPKGVMADHAARDANVGGEILCTVF